MCHVIFSGNHRGCIMSFPIERLTKQKVINISLPTLTYYFPFFHSLNATTVQRTQSYLLGQYDPQNPALVLEILSI